MDIVAQAIKGCMCFADDDDDGGNYCVQQALCYSTNSISEPTAVTVIRVDPDDETHEERFEARPEETVEQTLQRSHLTRPASS